MSDHEYKQTKPVHEKADQWHRHGAEEGHAQKEHAAKANPALLGVVLGVVVAATLGLVVLVVLYFGRATTDLRRERIETTALSAEANSYRAQAKANLDRPIDEDSWVDREAGTVRVPIEMAMDRVVERYAQRRRAGGGGS